MRKLLFLLPLAIVACSASTLSKLGVLEQKAIVAGQLFCAKETVDGPLVVAIVDSLGVPVVVTNVLAADVAAECAKIDAIPVAPPANPATAPIVAVAGAITAVQSAPAATVPVTPAS